MIRPAMADAPANHRIRMLLTSWSVPNPFLTSSWARYASARPFASPPGSNASARFERVHGNQDRRDQAARQQAAAPDDGRKENVAEPRAAGGEGLRSGGERTRVGASGFSRRCTVASAADRVRVMIQLVATKPSRTGTKTLPLQNGRRCSNIATGPWPCGLSSATRRYIGSMPSSVRATIRRVASGSGTSGAVISILSPRCRAPVGGASAGSCSAPLSTARRNRRSPAIDARGAGSGSRRTLQPALGSAPCAASVSGPGDSGISGHRRPSTSTPGRAARG